eukprot:scaffold35910_cov73-Skeletonema_marinoi.AAC.1
MRWDVQSKELRVPALGSFGSKLKVRSDVDFLSHTLRNVVLEPDTELQGLTFKDGIIENSILRNVTAVDLNLGDVVVETVSINDFTASDNVGAFVTVAEDGKLDASSTMKSNEGQLLINDDVIMSKSLQVEADLQVRGEAYLEGSLA